MRSETLAPRDRSRTGQNAGLDPVLRIITDYCQGLQPGDPVPTHQELMRRFEVPERSVRRALDELRRQGRIVRRRGARTFVADPASHSNGTAGRLGAGPERAPRDLLAGTSSFTEVRAPAARSVVAIAFPDHALFDQAMNMLVGQARIDDVAVVCQLLPRPEGRTFGLDDLPVLPENPLGFIVFRRELLPLAEQLHAQGHRVVSLATPFADVVPRVPVIHGDQRYGGYIATKHLLELGHRNIGFFGYGDVVSTQRWQGHRRALREAAMRGIRVEDCVLDLELLDRWKQDPAAVRSALTGPAAPTGLVVWNDHDAARVLGLLEDMGIRVPDDVSLVGYDNLPEGTMVRPRLTTVYSSMEQQLQSALELLTRDQPPMAPFQLVISPSLVARDSSAPR